MRWQMVAGGGIGMVLLLLLLLFFDPNVVGRTGPRAPGVDPSASPRLDPTRDFVSVVLADAGVTWREVFRRMNREYRDPKLVLFTGAVQSPCGLASSAIGPFYCAQDERIYLDLDFFRDLGDRFGTPGDFAQAYVIAHEVGHHVQHLLKLGGNAVPVRRELQADCFAGIWAHDADRTRHILESGDLDQGLAAAAAVGDDRLQRGARGHVVLETFTHGTAAQRARWFRRGFDSGDVAQCDTWSTGEL